MFHGVYFHDIVVMSVFEKYAVGVISSYTLLRSPIF